MHIWLGRSGKHSSRYRAYINWFDFDFDGVIQWINENFQKHLSYTVGNGRQHTGIKKRLYGENLNLCKKASLKKLNLIPLQVVHSLKTGLNVRKQKGTGVSHWFKPYSASSNDHSWVTHQRKQEPTLMTPQKETLWGEVRALNALLWCDTFASPNGQIEKPHWGDYLVSGT